ncbi:aminopeptidase N [Roseibium aquae]|uniref:Aminopeptidase N n=1 Tax=Roseibium aquae TaxID=1323746 RepID=A0A916TN09_9HYPH|nr:aminopeptidase N [Roseibium aquae]GGB63104.1 aminopeptidase N [Roseibium aquae]
MRPDAAPAIRLEDYTPSPYRIDRVHLTVKLAPTATSVEAKLWVRAADHTTAGTPLVLDGDALTLTGLELNGLPLLQNAFMATPARLDIKDPPSGPFTLKITTQLDPENNTALMGLYRSSGTYCTQCEAEGFRRITYFLDRPDVLSVYTTRIEARASEAPVLLSNGNLLDHGKIAGTDRHFAVWHDPHPKPSYLFALVAGDLARVTDSFTTMSGRPVALNIYVEHGREGLCDWAMDSLKRSMRWDETVFGREYDLEVFNIVAVSDFNMGAMENKGLNIFNDKYILADPETATDQDYANIEAVIAHEYFHNWTGNRITCRDWFQLCLKEGLTVFRDQEFSGDMRSRAVKRISDVRLLKTHQFPEDAGPLAHPVRPRKYKEINNFYTATVYEKGAEIVRMLKTWLGDGAFRDGMNLYFRRHDGEATTIEAFIACFQEASGKDLTQFFRWYEQAGTPKVTVRSAYDRKAMTLTLHLNQTIPPLPGQPSAQPAVIPLRFALLDERGQEVIPARIDGAEVRGDVLTLDRARQTVTFHGIDRPVLPSLGRGFSAPVQLELDQNTQDFLFLASHDADPFNRWQSLQTLSTRELIRLTGHIRAGEPAEPDRDLVQAFGGVLGDDALEPAFRALALTLPTELDIARELGQSVDPDAIHAAQRLLLKAIATAHSTAFETAAASPVPGPYSPDAKAAGQRALVNKALGYLALTGGEETARLIARRFEQADNMTDRIAALTLLVHHDLADAPKALDAFRKRHAGSPLAMDKWFQVQATAPSGATLARLRALTRDPLYDASNPNRIRALVQSFAMGNPTQFARKDGAGFAFVADSALAIDGRNPQVASMLLTSFRSWRSLETARAKAAESILKRVFETGNLSRDSADIVERCLQ